MHEVRWRNRIRGRSVVVDNGTIVLTGCFKHAFDFDIHPAQILGWSYSTGKIYMMFNHDTNLDFHEMRGKNSRVSRAASTHRWQPKPSALFTIYQQLLQNRDGRHLSKKDNPKI